eukprot:UN17057
MQSQTGINTMKMMESLQNTTVDHVLHNRRGINQIRMSNAAIQDSLDAPITEDSSPFSNLPRIIPFGIITFALLFWMEQNLVDR